MKYSKDLDPWADEPVKDPADVPKELGVMPESLTEGDIREYEEGKREERQQLNDRLTGLKDQVAQLASKRELAATELARQEMQNDPGVGTRIDALKEEIDALNMTEEKMRDRIAQTKVEIEEMDRND